MQTDDVSLLPTLASSGVGAQHRLRASYSFGQFHIPWVEGASRLAETGFIQALIIAISLVWISVRVLNREASTKSHPEHRASRVRWSWEACALTTRLLALIFTSLAAAYGQTEWLNVVCTTYAFALGLSRLINDREWRHVALHQVNFVLTAVLFVLVASNVLPCIEVQQQCSIPFTMTGALASLSLSVLVALSTPREWAPPPLTHSFSKAALREEPAPEETCSWAVYYLTYEWLTPLLWKGTRRQVTVDDLPKLAWYDNPELLLSKIKRARAQGKTTAWTIILFLHEEGIIMACCIMVAYIAELIAPFALYQLLSYLADPEGSIVRPWVWLLLMFCGPLLRSIFHQQYIFTSTRVIVRIKSAMTQELYHGAMSSMELEDDVFALHAASGRVPHGQKSAQRGTSAGRLANLMAADVDAIWGARDIIMIGIGIPTGTLVAIFGLYKMMGWPALVGASVLLLTSPVSLFIAQLMAKATRTVRSAQDSRISLVSEYLSSIRAIKYFAWEDAALKKIQEARSTEQRQLWRVSVLYVCMNQLTQLIPFISLLSIFSLHVAVRREPLTAATAFTTLYLVKTIRKNLVQASSLSKKMTAAAVAISRIDRYFENTIPIQRYPAGPLSIRNASFRRSKQAKFELRSISIDFVEHGLNVISGPSGCGKTTLLLAILGETDCQGGSVTRPRDAAFASQTTWLQNDTIRDNIVFHSVFEKVRYDKIVKACCLPFDLDQLDSGDQTLVGENGASLSGGQKARVALARALYSKAPLLLLDDVFSALDAKTSALVWERCFCGDLLKGRTIVLVAQQPWAAAQADLSITLENGGIASVERNLGVTRRSVAVLHEAAEQDCPGELDMELQRDELNNTSKKADERGGNDLVSQEMISSGKSTRLMFFRYMAYFGSPWYAVLCIAVMLFAHFAWLGGSLWISVWVEAYDKEDAVDIAFYLGVYTAFALAESFSIAAVILAFENGAWQAARRLHTDFINAVMKVSLSWYKNVPVGRVVNRFSRDMSSIDTAVCNQLQRFLDNAMAILFRIGAISSILPVFILPATVSCFAGVMVGEMYTRTAVTLKKLVSSAQSPVFTQFADTLAGLAVIRGREGMPDVFGQILADRLRVWSRAAEANYNCNRWVAMRIDVITALVSLCAGIIAVSKAGVVGAGLVGFSLTNATGLSTTILSLVRSMNDLEVELQSFVRVKEYAGLEPEEKDDQSYPEEGDYADHPSQIIPNAWPSTGQIEFRNITIRYDLEGPDILTNVNLRFNAGERVAIVGRTGSGKSTLVLSLLRFTHIISGQILYDGIDITKIPRRRLRESLTIIPQEAVLFNGTVETNLDPTETMAKEMLEQALLSCRDIASFRHQSTGNAISDASLADCGDNGLDGENSVEHAQPSSNGITLATPVAPKGENFSHGQRQVLSLCRALLRKSRLMLLDEATASMDYETDRGIQDVLRRELGSDGTGDRTLVTIAHRLRTIVDYDTVVVMGEGKVSEVGAPKELYERGGTFYDMVRHSGEGSDLERILKGQGLGLDK